MANNIWQSTASNDWGTAANWSLTAVPVNSDVVYLTNNTIDITAGLTQNTVTLASFNYDLSYTGLVGTSGPGYLYIGATTFNLGTPAITAGSGSRRMNIRAANSGAIVNVFSSGSSANDTNSTPNRLLGTALVLNAFSGTTGVAIGAGETASVATLNMTGTAPTVIVGPGCTTTTASVYAGQLTNQSTAAVTTATVLGNGSLLHTGSGGYTTLTAGSRTSVTYNGTGTIGTLNLTGTLDLSGGSGAVTVTNANLYAGSQIIDPLHRITFTNPFQTVQCRLVDVSVNLGTNKNYQVS